MSSAKATRPRSPVRRSTRKTKKIFREDERGREQGHPSSVHRVPPSIENNCKKMMQTDSKKNTLQLLGEMELALRSQCQRLEENFQIKLKLDQCVPLRPSTARNCPAQGLLLLSRVEQQERGEEEVWSALGREQPSMENWSLPQEPEVEEGPVLRRHESARLLCDNYQKQELIYSVQTLIPRLLREDLQLNFSHPH